MWSFHAKPASWLNQVEAVCGILRAVTFGGNFPSKAELCAEDRRYRRVTTHLQGLSLPCGLPGQTTVKGE